MRRAAPDALGRPSRYLLGVAISDDEIAQVRSATDLVGLISETVALKRSGQRWTGLCPFHPEKTPSFSVNAELGRYYCFGCRASGDAITWLRETHHLDFVDALRLLGERAGITLHDDAATTPARRERRAALDAMERAVAWYHDRLLHAPDARGARDYLRSRGIGGELARQFRIGWAPDEWDALARALDLSDAALVASGLGFVNRRERRQDALRARVIFPIFDPSGKAVAVGGRILTNVERSDGYVEPKYKNSPETAIYSKRRTLYGLNLAKDDVIRSGEIIVCEGYTDVIACFAAGLPRAVATCGTALGEEHFRLMKNFAKRIVLAYDADVAGQSAAASVYQWERQHEVDVAVARLPVGLDPAELAQRDPSALRDAVQRAVPFLEFRLERVLQGANIATPEGRARAGEAALYVLAEHPSELVRDQYLMVVADRLRLEVASLRPRVVELVSNPESRDARSRGEGAPGSRPPTTRPLYVRPSLPRPGLLALRHFLHGGDDVRRRFVAPYFVDRIQRQIFEALDEQRTTSDVIDDLERDGQVEASLLLSELAVQEAPDGLGESNVGAVVAQLIRAAVREEMAALSREMREGSAAPDVVKATIDDVQARLGWLETADGDVAEVDLRTWLEARERGRD